MNAMSQAVSDLVRASTENFVWEKGEFDGTLFARKKESKDKKGRPDIEVNLNDPGNGFLGFYVFLPGVFVTKRNRPKLEKFLYALDLVEYSIWNVCLGRNNKKANLHDAVIFHYQWVCPEETINPQEICAYVDFIAHILYTAADHFYNYFDWIARGEMSVTKAVADINFGQKHSHREWGHG